MLYWTETSSIGVLRPPTPNPLRAGGARLRRTARKARLLLSLSLSSSLPQDWARALLHDRFGALREQLEQAANKSENMAAVVQALWQKIKAGDKVVMWYISGNRDERRIERPNEFIIDRANPRHHLSFGFGIHRCLGNRLGEMQLTILWEEIVRRLPKIEVVDEPVYLRSNFIHGIRELMVRIPK